MFLILLNTELLVPGTKINIKFEYVMSSIVEKFTSSNVILIVHSGYSFHHSSCQKRKIFKYLYDV
jgi:hypothetical protein